VSAEFGVINLMFSEMLTSVGFFLSAKPSFIGQVAVQKMTA